MASLFAIAFGAARGLFSCACRFLDKAALSDRAELTGHGHAVSRTQVEETKAFIGIMPLYLCICIYQARNPALIPSKV